mmetsp:Transcript_27442/g.58136  ORF Transcript_27442/g.58136 Transcript_27442/m.58136 type:complete len:211 (-) Transcript_27442:87-719(-)
MTATTPIADRVPRYFDPEAEWERRVRRCYRCGGAGHILRDCPYDATQKPCFLCGQFGHVRAECPNTLCYRCLKPGHTARECREARAVYRICLRCGSRNCANSNEHEFDAKKCSFEYHTKDLALVTCIDCGKKGHLSCNVAGGAVNDKKRGGSGGGDYQGFITCACCGEDTHHHSECRYMYKNKNKSAKRGREDHRQKSPNDLRTQLRRRW